MKVKMIAYGLNYNLHCPRCGYDEFSDVVYNSGTNLYHKCMHCGSDVCTDNNTRIGIVTENPFFEFTPMTYDDIKKEISTNKEWKSVPIPEYERGDA